MDTPSTNPDKIMIRSSRCWSAACRFVLLFTAAVLPPALAQAQPAEDFYRGKSINLVIGYPPAGANDVYARMVAHHLGKHIPGNPSIVPRNVPGAGSLLAASRIFNIEPKDGTTLGLLVPTLPLDEKLGNPAANYRAAGFNWIGRMAPAPNVTFIMNTSAVKTIDDAFDKVAILGATGKSATNSIYPTVLNNVLGTKFKIVNGYEGSAAVMLAMERGEVEGHSSTYDSLKAVHPDWIAGKRVNVVVQYMLRRHPDLAQVPTSIDLAKTDEQRAILTAVSSASEIGKFVLTTPGAPADRVTALRRAFDAMVKDPDFIDEAQKLRVELLPLPGEELQRIVESVQNLTPELTQKIKAMYPIN
jgi:tripartite-type tricarboxylate transporter receptor subunit TctC